MFVLVLVCEGYSYSKCKNSLGITKLPSVSAFILNDPFSVKTAVYAMGSLVETSFTKKDFCATAGIESKKKSNSCFINTIWLLQT